MPDACALFLLSIDVRSINAPLMLLGVRSSSPIRLRSQKCGPTHAGSRRPIGP